MTAQDLKELVLEHINSPDYRPVKPRTIAKQLGLSKDRHRDLRKTIKKLARQGKVTYGDQHLVEPGDPAAKKKTDESLVTGQFRRAAKGYGFVTPIGTLPSEGRTKDILIPLRHTSDAATGDTVKVRLKRRRPDENRLSGAIVEVIERETNQFVGVYMERSGEPAVQIDGRVFTEPVPVGDPGAKNAIEGDKVVVEMVRFPTHYHEGEGVIVEVLGARGTPGVDTLSIIREFNLPDRFPNEVMDTARAQAGTFDEAIGDRLDLTGETIITIDPKDARDFDDAISLERLENGHWRLGVHIADVAHFVPVGSPLDREARERATSIYLPSRVIPMLPELISNGLASLQPRKVRYAKTAFIEFTADGARVGAEFHNSAIKSKRRFAYEEVDQFLADPHRWKSKLTTGVFSLLGRMHELAMILRRRRLEAGAIELTLPEIKIDLDKKGRVGGAHVVQHTDSHRIIEEFMLAANEAVAEHLNDQQLNFLRRVHEPPDPRKLEALTEFVRELGIDCDHLQSRFEIKRVVEQVAGEPREHAVHYAVLRSMRKAVYGPQEEGHYALASRHYCHFTSPIRRYPDLVIHRMLDSLARGERPPDDFDQLAVLGGHCSDREQRAEAAERELVKVKLLTFLSKRIGEHMEAVITGVEQYGMFTQGIELPAEGLIRVDTLADDYYRYDRQTHTLTGNRRGNTFRLGDIVEVEIAHVDVDRRELDFRLTRRLKEASGRPNLTAKAKPKAKKKAAARKKTARKRKVAKKKVGSVRKKTASKKTKRRRTT
ncbi:MAG: ribonuclease R [Pirellulaceae bacterium]|nr:ribonuclease R [Pirellulaceae bacterium]